MSVQVGVVVPQNEIGDDPAEIVRWAAAVERLGFHYLDVFDHVLGADTTDRPEWPGPYTVDHEFHEPFVLYAFLAPQVPRLGLATGVLVLPQRQTALVAKQAAELDLLSGGRLRLGVGIGWNPVEYEALGARFADRAARYEEQVLVLRRLWTERCVDLDGVHHRIDRAGLAPLPRQRPIPIWMGGGTSAPVLDRIGRLADGWMAHEARAGDQLAAALGAIAESARRAGRDPSAIGLQGRVDVHGRLDDDRFRVAVDRWLAAGATHLSIHLAGQGRGADPHLDAMARVAEALAGLLAPTPDSEALR